ncbi:beta strand repeat-containing protein, partial [Bacteroidota bacterium]
DLGAGDLTATDITATGTISGSITTTGDLKVNDNQSLIAGTGDDLSITHDGANTDIVSATGDLTIDNTDATGSTNVQLGTDDAATDFGVLNNTGTSLLTVAGDGNVDVSTHDGGTVGLELGGTLITATAAELNTMDGITSTTAELNILDGVTADAAELNTMDGITSTTAELNILDGVTADAAELNLLDGVTATTTELNYVDVAAPGTAEATKALVTDASLDIDLGAGDLTATDITATGTINADGDVTLGNAATDVITITGEVAGASPLVFEGGTDNGITTTFAIAEPTGVNKTITFPDATGTVALVSAGTNWVLGGNAPGAASVLGTTDNSDLSIESGTGALNLGADAAAKTITLGNTTGATAVDINTGTGGLDLNVNNNQPTNINTGTSTGDVTIGNAANTVTLPALSTTGIVHNNASGDLSTSLIVNADITDATIDLTAKVTGTLPVANGGTGVATFGGANTILYTTAANTLSSIATANDGILITNGTGVPSISATLPEVNLPAGTMILLYADETGSNGTVTTADTKTYALAANTYSKIMVEIEVAVDQSSTTAADWTFTIQYGAVSKTAIPLSADGSHAGDSHELLGVVKTSDAQAAGVTISIDVSGSGGTWYVDGFRVYGVI